MSSDNCENCNEHSGMESRQKLLIWMLGILIAVLVTVGGAQINMMMAIGSDVAVIQSRLTDLDYRYASSERMRVIEQDVAALKMICRQAPSGVAEIRP